MIRPPPTSTLFPYTTLFRSLEATEGQFTALLDAAGGSHPVQLRFSCLPGVPRGPAARERIERDRKSTRLNSSHMSISYAVFCLKKKKRNVTVFPVRLNRLSE